MKSESSFYGSPRRRSLCNAKWSNVQKRKQNYLLCRYIQIHRFLGFCIGLSELNQLQLFDYSEMSIAPSKYFCKLTINWLLLIKNNNNR
jgi:hypothetical protein